MDSEGIMLEARMPNRRLSQLSQLREDGDLVQAYGREVIGFWRHFGDNANRNILTSVSTVCERKTVIRKNSKLLTSVTKRIELLLTAIGNCSL